MPAASGTVRVPVDLRIVVGMQVNGSWGHNEPGGIDHLCRIAGLQTTNFRDLAVLNAKVGSVAGDASAIDDSAVFNDRIELWHNSLLVENTGYTHALCLSALATPLG